MDTLVVKVCLCLDSPADREVSEYLRSAPPDTARDMLVWAYLARRQGNVAFDEAAAETAHGRLAAEYRQQVEARQAELDKRLQAREREFQDRLHELDERLQAREREYKARLQVQEAQLAALKEREDAAKRSVELVVEERTCTLERVHERELRARDDVIRRLTESTDAQRQLEQVRGELAAVREAVRSSTSVYKGADEEQELARLFGEAYPEWKVDALGKTAHSGDIHIRTPQGRVVVEIKNKQATTRGDTAKYASDVRRMVDLYNPSSGTDDTCAGPVVGAVFIVGGSSDGTPRIDMGTIDGVPSLTLVHPRSDRAGLLALVRLFVQMCVALAEKFGPVLASTADTATQARVDDLVGQFGEMYARLVKDMSTASKDAQKIANSMQRCITRIGELQALVLSMV